MGTDYLDSYPHLRSLWPRELIESLDATDHRYNWAHASHPEADKIRQHLEEALAWASSNGFLSHDLRGRLSGKARMQFHSAKDELLVGKFLTRAGKVKPATVLPSGRIGDWLIDGKPPIYVEVKSIYGVDEEVNRVQVQLRQIGHDIGSGRVLEVSIVQPGTLSPKAFRSYLETSLAALPSPPSEEVKLPDYVDPSGLTLSIACLPLQVNGPTQVVITWGGSGPIISHLQVQERACRGASQLPQPEEGIPSMVVICRHSDVPDTGLELLGAAFSLPAINLQTGEWSVQLAGISRPDRHTRVSAIAQFFEHTEKLEVVHNPLAKNSINPCRLSAPGIRQLVPDGSKRMRWVEST